MRNFNEWVEKRVIEEGLRVVRLPQAGGKPHIFNAGNIQLRLMRDTETQEFVVAWFENGKYNEEASYRGGSNKEDFTDALQTMDSMARRILAQQQQKPTV